MDWTVSSSLGPDFSFGEPQFHWLMSLQEVRDISFSFYPLSLLLHLSELKNTVSRLLNLTFTTSLTSPGQSCGCCRPDTQKEQVTLGTGKSICWSLSREEADWRGKLSQGRQSRMLSHKEQVASPNSLGRWVSMGGSKVNPSGQDSPALSLCLLF